MHDQYDKISTLASCSKNFGRCCWNSDVNKGRSLLSQRSEEISLMAKDLLGATWDNKFSVYQAAFMQPSSNVSWELANLTKRIDDNFWNWLCNLFTGFSRSIKNEERKLNELVAEYHRGINSAVQKDSNLNTCITLISFEIDSIINRYTYFFEQNKNVEELERRLLSLENNINELGSKFVRENLIEKIQQAKKGQLKSLLEP